MQIERIGQFRHDHARKTEFTVLCRGCEPQSVTDALIESEWGEADHKCIVLLELRLEVTRYDMWVVPCIVILAVC